MRSTAATIHSRKLLKVNVIESILTRGNPLHFRYDSVCALYDGIDYADCCQGFSSFPRHGLQRSYR